MATNPLKSANNRATEIKSANGDVKQSISLFDIDYAMMSYLEDTVLPTLDDNGKAMKIPVIYGNSERWKGARRDGIYRDMHGKIQLPLMMIRRTSIAKDDTMPMLNRHLTYQSITKYSKDNKYDKFSLLGKSTQPKYQIYNIKMPEYVDLSYDCMGWTSYVEHLNQIIEQLNFTGQYWGDKNGFKFRVSIADYNIVNEVGEGTERINRVEFTFNVKAYLLPEKFDGESTVKKSMSTKSIIVTTETDVTGNGRLEGLLTTPSAYYDNKDLIDFLSINNSKSQNPTTNNTITFTGIKLINTPAILSSVVTAGLSAGADIRYDVKVYINGVRYYETSHFTWASTSNALTLTFLPIELAFNVDSGDEVIITGKFIDV
jgi:hypothetical protein